MFIAVAHDTAKAQKFAIEGPTRRQAVNMAAFRLRLLEQEKVAQAAGDDEGAFELSCDAWDIEADLRRFGFAKLLAR